jgi:hypothetical protein
MSQRFPPPAIAANSRAESQQHESLVDRLTLWFAVGSGAFLYVNLFLLPRIPILQAGDQMFFWMDAQRMLFGERIYRDFFQFTPPGTDYFYFALFKLFGLRIWVTNAAILFLGVVLCVVCFSLTRQVMNRWPALLAVSLFLTLIYSKLLNATHHWFSVLAILIAVAIVMRGQSLPRIAAAGALLGVASFFTQTHGAVAAVAIAVWLLWNEFFRGHAALDLFKGPVVLLASYAIALLALASYFLITIGPKHLWYSQVAYVRHYMVTGLSSFPGLPEAVTVRRLPVVGQYIFVCVILPMVYPLALVRCLRPLTDSDERRRSIVLLALLGLGLFLEVALSPNWLRIYTVAVPGIIVLTWFADASRRGRRPALALICMVVIALAARDTWVRQRQHYVVADLPAGRTALVPAAFEKLNAVMQRTQPGDFFFQAMWPGAYIPLHVRNPVYLDTVRTNDETRPEFLARSIAQLEEKRIRYILWSQRLNKPDPEYPGSDHLDPLLDYLHARYQRVEVFADGDELWQRKR